MGEDQIDIYYTCTGLSQYYFDNDFQHAYANGIDLNEHLDFTPVQGRQG